MALTNTPTTLKDRPRNANVIGTPAEGLDCIGEFGMGALRCTALQFKDMSVVATRNGTTSAYGSQALYTFPRANVMVLGVFARLAVTRGESSNMQSGAAFYHSIGTSAVGAGSGATNTDATNQSLVNIAPATLLTLVGGGVTGNVSSIGAMAQLTDNSGGTAADTIAAIGGTYTQSEVRNAVASLAAKVNRLVQFANAMRIANIDGTSVAAKAYLNFSNTNGASAQIATGDSSLSYTGNASIFWVNLGDTSAIL